jgi:L-alanine-DL-glutamate epimerase-like enolase superfamily enzyme
MKIKSIQTIPIKLYMKEPFVIANVTNFDMYYVIVKVETDEGINGYGEATPAWEVTGETYQSVMACVELFNEGILLGYSLLGREIGSLEAVREIMDTIEPRTGVHLVYGNPSAIAAIEQALLDACGKFLHQPIYGMFGASNQPIRFTRNISILDVDSTLQRVATGIELGYQIIRLKVGLPGGGGLPGRERDVQVVIQSRQLIEQSGKPLLLIADANQGFGDVETTVAFCRRIEGKLDWLEQPTAAGDLMAFSKIHQKTGVPLMVDEALHSFEQAHMLLELGGVDYFNIKLMKTGGLLRAIDIIDLAAEHGVKCQIGSMIESSLGASMGCQAALIRPQVISTDLNSFDLLQENFASGLTLEGTRLLLDPGEGCGMHFAEQSFEKFALA